MNAKPKILLVDDEEMLLELLSSELQELGWPVVGASSADQGERLLIQDRSIRVVISDVRMPGRTGLDFARSIRDFDPKIPVILMSGYADYTEEDYQRAGIYKRLVKPFKMAELEAILASLESIT